MKTMKGWHFVGEKLRDGRPVPKDGVWLKHKRPLELCAAGLHWSKDPFDALQFAPGPILCQIEARGETLIDSDKCVSVQRRIMRRMDATEMLRYFARMQALSVIDAYPNGTDDAVFDYLMTGDEAAESAARSAAESAARSAWSARSAAESAVESARSAAWSAARSAAWSAAESAARSAWSARSAAESAESAWSARSAAWSARSARSAAESAQREYFNLLVSECFR